MEIFISKIISTSICVLFLLLLDLYCVSSREEAVLFCKLAKSMQLNLEATKTLLLAQEVGSSIGSLWPPTSVLPLGWLLLISIVVCCVLYFDYHTILLFLVLSCSLCTASFVSCYIFYTVFFFFVLGFTALESKGRKQLLYLREVLVSELLKLCKGLGNWTRETVVRQIYAIKTPNSQELLESKAIVRDVKHL
ncbi:hypothetical protein H5410_000136 [Solanum commersonii]|uniref:Uncharacterized protein n=1 Tax=Solanum commersonii TaxID=4109 RepID=A0A9J6AVZ3_SOLCO|nr:hypothetical protein H5410_000136 [Solanum commersonii]